MKKFLVLYMSPVPAVEQMAKATPDQAKAGMDLWMAWANKNSGSILEMGSPLGIGLHMKSDSISPGSTHVVGYSIIQADTLESATKMMDGHPHFHTPRGTIEILEFLSLPGM
jgi:hypothetical protein